MSEDRATEILKNAILLEKRGQAFYGKVAAQAASGPVKNFFALMADEETRHVQMLSEQFKSYRDTKKFKPERYTEPGFATASRILTEELKRQISAADFEAAAVAAAMSMEKNAIEIYNRRAGEAQDPDEKALYGWLAKWEGEHLAFLSRLDREITEQVWNDNNFWPF